MSTGCDTENSLLATSDARDWLGIKPNDTQYDATLNDIINYVSYRFNGETGRQLKSRQWTEYHDGDGSNTLYLNQFPISSTTITITIDADRVYTTDLRVTDTDIMLSTESGRVRLDDDTFDIGTRNVKVVYSAGYTTSGAFDLVLAAKELVQLMWNRYTKKDMVGLRTDGYEGGTRTYENDLPWSVKKVLDMYRDRRYGVSGG
jgi:hypothetical protein